MPLLRETTMGLLTAGVLQAMSATGLLHPEALLEPLAAGRLAPAWTSDLGDPPSRLALRAPSARAAPGAAEPNARRIAAEQAVPPFAMFLVETFGHLS